MPVPIITRRPAELISTAKTPAPSSATDIGSTNTSDNSENASFKFFRLDRLLSAAASNHPGVKPESSTALSSEVIQMRGEDTEVERIGESFE